MGNTLAIAPGVTLKSVEVIEDSRNGNSTVYTYRGSQLDCAAQRILERAYGATTLRLSPVGDGYWELVATYPYDTDQGIGAEQPTDVHELEVEVAQPDVYQNLRLRGLLGVNEKALLSLLATTVGKYEKGDYGEGQDASTAAESRLWQDSLDIINDLTIAEIVKRAFQGIAYRKVQSFIEYRTVYRRTLTAASPAQVSASFVGVGQIWTTAEMRNYEVLPADWWFTLPVDWQWLKSMPQVNTVSGQKTQITYNYTAALQWWGILYEAYGTAVLLDDDAIP